MKIKKENILSVTVYFQGSSFMRFKTDLSFENETLGDFYWQGDVHFFEVNMFDLINDRNEEFEEEGGIENFLEEDAVNFIKHLAEKELADFV